MSPSLIVRPLFLVAGAAIIVAAAIFTLTHMQDRTVFTVLLPGVVVGLLLIVLSRRGQG